MQIQTSTLPQSERFRLHDASQLLPAPVVALAAIAILLFRYTREAVIVLAWKRASAAAHQPLQVTLAHDTTVDALIRQIERQVRAPSSTPFWDSGELIVRWSELASGERSGAEDGPFLSLSVELSSMSVTIGNSAQRGLISTSNPLRDLGRHFAAIAQDLRAHRRTRIADVPLLSRAELHRVAGLWSRGEARPDFADPGLLHELFEAQVRAHPDRVAVVCGKAQLTYRELDARAERVAADLGELGIGRGSFVAFQLPRSMEVYVALLGILKAGAAYVPLDPECPPERARYVLADCKASALLTTGPLQSALGTPPCPVLRMDQTREARPCRPRAPRPAPSDVCYVIYTSGSTGQPKGVAIEHASARHLVRAEQHLFGVRASDRVFQGFSIAFDAAVEEVWLAFAAGATLVVGTTEVILGDLARSLTDAGVTIFSTVPTLLATVTGDLPTVRLLIVGGEACPQELANRWCAPSRRMFNTYGPTEATVIATYAELKADQPVTIGRPIPNYRTYVLDPCGHPVPAGVSGELCIGGVGLARGYLGNAALTAARFIPNPLAGEGDGPRVLYRTGDRARYTERGDLEFLGRLDDQVKLRGYRIELGEVEAALLGCAGVAQAVVVVREDTPGLKQLVAYVAPKEGATLAEEPLKERLRSRLPPYMIPASVTVVPRLPTLLSGKVDKRSLPPPRAARHAVARSAPPRDPIVSKITRAWASLFDVPSVGPDADFFHDLGGHSLLAAQMVSLLRRDPALSTLSVLDVYECPTAARLAERVRRPGAGAPGDAERSALEPDLSSAKPCASPRPAPAREPSGWRFRLCGAAQALSLYFVYALYAAQWLGPYLTYVLLRHAELSETRAFVGMGAVLVAACPAVLLASVAIKWLVIGRYKAGRYPLWGSYYFRWWLVDRVLALAPVGCLVGTPLLNLYYRLLGARIGKRTVIASESVGAFDLLSIGDDTTIDAEATLCGHAVEDGDLVLGPIRIGDRCVVGGRAFVGGGGAMENDSSLAELSMVGRGDTVPAGEHWAGSPARFAGKADRLAVPARPAALRRTLYALFYALCAPVLPALVLVAIVPGLVLFDRMHSYGVAALAVSPAVALAFVLLLCLEIAALKWLCVGRTKPGRHEVLSAFYLRKWLYDRAMALSLEHLGGLYATLFLNPWYRLLGVRLGKNAEVSTASGIVPDVLEIEAGAFIADCVSLGAARLGRGYVEVERTRIGRRAFIGNSAVVPAGAAVGEDCLLGCLSASPADPRVSTKRGSSWFGSPCVLLPQRQASTPFSEQETYRPTWKLRAQRATIELARVILPTSGFVALSCLVLNASVSLGERVSPWAAAAAFPLLYAAAGVLSALFVIALKWLLMGRYRPGEVPLWSTFVWRTELVSGLQENLAEPFFIAMLRGTPFLAWFFRAMGAKVGRRVYLGTTQFTEHDLVEIGDGACLNDDCTIQTHLFEDRVMKMAPIRVGDRCTVGSQALVLYGAHMEEGADLGPLSLVMKGEVVPAWSRWAGSPAVAPRRRASPRDSSCARPS